MIAKGIHHVSFSVADLAASRRFYGELLGLEEIPRPDFGIPGTWYRAGAGEVHLIARPPGAQVGSAPPRLTPLANHQAFAIEDYQKCLAHLEAHGVEVIATGARQGQLFVRDPDGNVIELIAPAARA